MCERECVCVCVRERKRVCVCVRERVRVCVKEREGGVRFAALYVCMCAAVCWPD